MQLGEQSHGDGTCFLTKTRLIKFLHQEMGFDVLAFESGLYDCHRAWQSFTNNEPPLVAAQTGVFGIWTGSRQTQALWRYLADQSQGNRPLELCGFDCQYTGAASRKYLTDDIKSLISDSGFEIDSELSDKLFEQIESLAANKTQPDGDKNRFLATLAELAEHLARTPAHDKSREREFWCQQIRSMIAHAEYRWPDDQTDTTQGIEYRDAQMAKNLVWLAEQYYPDRKMIVWAASFHIVRNIDQIDVPDGSIRYREMNQMGNRVDEALGDDVFTIGFTAYEGKAGAFFRPAFTLSRAPQGTLEEICKSAGLENGLVPLRNLNNNGGNWLAEKQYSRPLGYKWMKSQWNRNFDAIIFNQVMEPSTRE